MAIRLTANNGQIDLTKKMYKGDDGGYYIPSVDDEGNLSWVASEEDMASIDSVNIKGDKGDKGESGIYVGVDEPTGDTLIWVNPDGGETIGLATIEYVDEQIAKVETGGVDLSEYATLDYVDNAIDSIDMPDVSGFATKEEIPDVSSFVTETEVNTLISNALSNIGVAEEGAY